MMRTTKGGFQWQNWDFKNGYKPIQWRSTVSAPLCAACNKAVFPAEEIIAAGQKFHKFCLKCNTCGTLLNTSNVNEHEKKIYCVSCYRYQFGPRSVGRCFGKPLSFSVDTLSNSPNFNQIEIYIDNDYFLRKTSTGSSLSHASSEDDLLHSNTQIYVSKVPTHRPTFKIASILRNICPRCSKTVYSAEEVKAAGKSFHKRCYTCANCNGSIGSGRYSEHNGELYDNNCYQRLFGLKGIFTIRN